MEVARPRAGTRHRRRDRADGRDGGYGPALIGGPAAPPAERYCSTSARTSIAPPMLAAGILDAISIAASRSAASRNRYPPIASLASTNGPSVVKVLPFCTRTVVALSGGCISTPGVTAGFSLSAL